MKQHIKYVQIAKDQVRFSAIDGQIVILVKNYTKLLDTPEVHSDGNTHTYRVEVPDEIHYTVNDESMVNVGPKGNGGWKHEVACLPVESMRPLIPAVEPAVAAAKV